MDIRLNGWIINEDHLLYFNLKFPTYLNKWFLCITHFLYTCLGTNCSIIVIFIMHTFTIIRKIIKENKMIEIIIFNTLLEWTST